MTATWKSSVAGQLLLASLVAPALLACAAETEGGEELGQSRESLSLPLDGTPIVKSPIELLPRPFPFPWRNPEDLVSITAGDSHNCVMKRNGNVYCWGRDDHGQVGTGPTDSCQTTPNNCVDQPTRVQSVSFTTASQIDAGSNHVCALDGAGKAYCWGDGDQGQVGLSSITGWFYEPIAVSSNLVYTSISAGTMGSCGTADSGLYCWGKLPAGAVAQTMSTSPLQIYSPTGLAPTGVSVGYTHVCAQWVSGSYRETNCWGRNWEGQTGAAGMQPYSLLGQGPWNIGTDALRVVTQNTFTCADRPGPSGVNVVCWGAGGNGQLGTGITANTPDPQRVGGGTLKRPALPLSNVTTGSYHACALDPDGNAYCWGSGLWGQLGGGYNASGGADSSAYPVAVRGGLRFKAIAAGQLHTCGVGVDNHIYCWGKNYNGELGTGYGYGWVAEPMQAVDPV